MPSYFVYAAVEPARSHAKKRDHTHKFFVTLDSEPENKLEFTNKMLDKIMAKADKPIYDFTVERILKIKEVEVETVSESLIRKGRHGDGE